MTIATATACSSNPCLNGGNCQLTTSGGFFCICLTGFTGPNCQIQQSGSNCAASPCLNGGTCSDTSTGYFCKCQANYYGRNCDYQVTAQTCSAGDQNSANCASWATLGFCSFTYTYNSVPVPIYCPRSCGLCTTISGCYDTQTSCSTWASSGYCSSIDANLCKKSCSLCAAGISRGVEEDPLETSSNSTTSAPTTIKTK